MQTGIKQTPEQPSSPSNLENNAANADVQLSSKPVFPLVKEVVFVATVSSAQLLTQAGLGQGIAPIQIIGSSFDLSSSSKSLSWFPAAYSLTVGTFILFAGRLGDIWGHRRLFIAGWLWYAFWSLLVGISVYSNQIFFDIARAFQGMGPAVLLPNALAIIGRTYPPGPRKAMVFSIFGATAPGGFVLGAVFASLFAQLATWSWAYYSMAIFCSALAYLSLLTIPSDQRKEQQVKLEMFDVWGTITGVFGLILLNVAWNQAAIAGWPAPYTYLLLILGVLALGSFAVIESRVSHPLLPVKSLSSQNLYVLGCVSAGWASFGIWVYYLWRFLEDLRGVTPLLACAQYMPIGISGLCAAIVTGFILGRVSPEYIMLASMLAFTAGNLLIAMMPAHQNYWFQTFFAVIIMCWGMDMSFPTSTILLSDSMPPSEQGMAASIVNTVVNYSISLALGIAGTVESNTNTDGESLLAGYRSALYLATGLSSLGICIALAFVVSIRLRERR